MQSNSFSYSLKVWLTSVFLAPMMYLVVYSWVGKNYSGNPESSITDPLSTYLDCIILGGIFSLFTWIIFFLIVKVIMSYYPDIYQVKYTIAALGVLLTAGTFALVMPEAFRVHNEFFF